MAHILTLPFTAWGMRRPARPHRSDACLPTLALAGVCFAVLLRYCCGTAAVLLQAHGAAAAAGVQRCCLRALHEGELRQVLLQAHAIGTW